MQKQYIIDGINLSCSAGVKINLAQPFTLFGCSSNGFLPERMRINYVMSHSTFKIDMLYLNIFNFDISDFGEEIFHHCRLITGQIIFVTTLLQDDPTRGYSARG